MAEDKKSKAELDKILYQYQRQLNAPKVFSEKFPSISKTVSSDILHKEDRDIYNTLGKNVGGVKDLRSYRNAEETASAAAQDDYYKSKDWDDLVGQLRKKDKIKYDPYFDKDMSPSLSGLFNAPQNALVVNPNKQPREILDTIIHEHQHAKDFNANPKVYNQDMQAEGPPIKRDALAQFKKSVDDQDLYEYSDLYSTGHFLKPRSASINNLIDVAETVGKEQGLERLPDKNPEYDELNIIKDQLKGKSKPELSLFQKIIKKVGM